MGRVSDLATSRGGPGYPVSPDDVWKMGGTYSMSTRNELTKEFRSVKPGLTAIWCTVGRHRDYSIMVSVKILQCAAGFQRAIGRLA
jgi:hypothetical protein